MHAVGQAGDSNSAEDDPLAALKQEAAQAQQVKDTQRRQEEETANMIQQFQSGELDPDQIDDAELDEYEKSLEKNRKPWWKFWARR
jgi:hypothetical protein